MKSSVYSLMPRNFQDRIWFQLMQRFRRPRRPPPRRGIQAPAVTTAGLLGTLARVLELKGKGIPKEITALFIAPAVEPLVYGMIFISLPVCLLKAVGLLPGLSVVASLPMIILAVILLTWLSHWLTLKLHKRASLHRWNGWELERVFNPDDPKDKAVLAAQEQGVDERVLREEYRSAVRSLSAQSMWWRFAYIVGLVLGPVLVPHQAWMNLHPWVLGAFYWIFIPWAFEAAMHFITQFFGPLLGLTAGFIARGEAPKPVATPQTMPNGAKPVAASAVPLEELFKKVDDEFLTQMSLPKHKQDSERLRAILSADSDALDELMSEKEAKVYISDREIHFPERGRTVYLELDNPLRLGGRVIRVLRIKGIRPRLGPGGATNYPQAGYKPRVTSAGKIQTQAADNVPYGGMSKKSAEQHYLDMKEVLNRGGDSEYSIGWGVVSRRTNHGEAPPGFCLIGMETSDHRLHYEDPGRVWVVDYKQGDRWPFDSDSKGRDRTPDLFRVLGQRLRKDHDLGIFWGSTVSANTGVKGVTRKGLPGRISVYLNDYDDVVLAPLTGEKPAIEAARRFLDIAKVCARMDLEDLGHYRESFLRAYFKDPSLEWAKMLQETALRAMTGLVESFEEKKQIWRLEQAPENLRPLIDALKKISKRRRPTAAHPPTAARDAAHRRSKKVGDVTTSMLVTMTGLVISLVLGTPWVMAHGPAILMTASLLLHPAPMWGGVHLASLLFPSFIFLGLAGLGKSLTPILLAESTLVVTAALTWRGFKPLGLKRLPAAWTSALARSA